MKLIIAGGRDFDDYTLLRDSVNEFCKTHYVTEIVSGTARGADKLGEEFASIQGEGKC